MLDPQFGPFRRTFVALCFVAATFSLPGVARAQQDTNVSADDSPFRSGQIGAEFGIGGSFASVGLLRFSDPQRAWLLDLQAIAARHSAATSLDDEESTDTGHSLALRLGHRRYRAVTTSVQRFTTFGVSGRVSGGSSDNGGWSENGAGAFAELGGAWMVRPNFSLGAVWSASLEYQRYTDERPTSVLASRSELELSLGTVRVRGNIYF